MQLINYGLLPLMTFRALATLSRGGLITAVLMFIGFLAIYFLYTSGKQKATGLFKIGIVTIGGIFIFSTAVVATGGMVFNKYTNRNAKGVKQEEAAIATGRGELAKAEFNTFAKQSFFWGRSRLG